jgi:hypothetical protein
LVQKIGQVNIAEQHRMDLPDSYYDRRRALLKDQAAILGRRLLESAGQLTLFSDRKPSTSTQAPQPKTEDRSA